MEWLGLENMFYQNEKCNRVESNNILSNNIQTIRQNQVALNRNNSYQIESNNSVSRIKNILSKKWEFDKIDSKNDFNYIKIEVSFISI